MGEAGWLERIGAERPRYLAIVTGLAEAIARGDLQPGERLPSQRALAAVLGVDLTTVTRAFAEAQARGLVEATVGRGAFVKATAAELDARVDLSMNLPPPPEGVSLGEELSSAAGAILRRADIGALMTYQAGAGGPAQRAAGAAWLAPVLGRREDLLVCAGAQAGLAASLSVLCRPGDVVAAEPLTYPGLMGVSAQLGLRVVACPADGEGPTPEGLAAVARTHQAKALYVVPTLQNPTATTLSEGRRRALARAARLAGMWIVEDDPYSRLLEAPLPGLASLAPDRTVHIATLSKTLTPGLRVAFLAAPPDLAGRIDAALRALTLMPAPLMTGVATQWIREGRAAAILAGVRREARARRALAARLLPAASGGEDSLHVWLPQVDGVRAERLRAGAWARGVSLVGGEAFAVEPGAPAGLRISLGGPARRTVLAEALEVVAAAVE